MMTSPAVDFIKTIGLSNLLLLLLGGGLFSLAVFGLLVGIIALLSQETSPVKERLRVYREKGIFQGIQKSRSAFDELGMALLTVATPIANKLYGQNIKYHKQVKTLLSEAGLMDSEESVNRFLAQRAAVGLVLGGLGTLIMLIVSKGTLTMILLGLLAGFTFGSMGPQYILKSKATDRKAAIRYSLSDTLDLMVVCVEAGLSLDATFHRIVDDMERMAPEMAYEVRRLNKELSAGVSRVDAFQALGLRTGVDELRSLCTLIIQSDRMGTSIAETLRIYSIDLRVRRRQQTEELAAKASTKLTFPLVLFVFPPLLIILLGPVVITAMKNFGNGMP
jgi:tight adherence protein C